MAESSLSRLLQAEKNAQAHSSHLHPLSPSLHHPRRSASFTSLPPENLHPDQASSLNSPTGYFDIPAPSGRRHHAATISTSSIPGGVHRASEADLLGVGPSQPRSRRSTPKTKSSPALRDVPVIEDVELPSEHVAPGENTQRPRRISRADSHESRPLSFYIDSLTKEEAGVVEMRFDLMSNQEIDIYLRTLYPSYGDMDDDAELSPTTPRATAPSTLRPLRKQVLGDDKSPLFPPSPPSGQTARGGADHPLRILSRTIRELKEAVEKLEEENEQLRKDLATRRVPRASRDKQADQASIHDGLTEALSTSLTPPSVIAGPNPTSHHFQSSPDSRPAAIPPTTQPRSPSSSISVPFPSSPILPSSASIAESSFSGIDQASRRSNNRSSWTSGLWVWNKGKPRPVRKPSTGSLASGSQGQGATTAHGFTEHAIDDDEDGDGWRMGDGGSPPSFRAIFLATRIITPDPSSILVSSSIPSNSLVAYLAHSLVSSARDDGITAREPPGRRNSKSRSRAASVVSAYQEGQLQRSTSRPDTPSKDAKGYGDQALAVGRSLFSSVSSATLRGTKAIVYMGDDQVARPSLLSRVSSSRPFPTTAVSPPLAPDRASSSATSPTAEQPPVPSVELASIVPDETRPPTVLLSRQNLGSFFQSTKAGKSKLMTATRFKSDEPPLTDRYGFIYDIQHAGMLKDASVAGTPAPASLTGNIPVVVEEGEGWIDKRRRSFQEKDLGEPSDRSPLDSPRRSIDSARSGSRESLEINNGLQRASTPDSITPPTSRSASHIDANQTIGRHRSPSNLMNLNPSPARPITAKDHLTISARGASSLVSNVAPTSVTTLSSSLANPSPADTSTTASRATVSSLLEQLTEIHDKQQKDRKTAWDVFLKKRSKHRLSESQGTSNRRGETEGVGLIGINQMGLSGKAGHEEYKQFLRLVRGGIPLAYRGDIWAECSGAKDLMVPGEYAEILEKHANEDSPVQADIEKDVSRTFPGNLFFGGDGPGVAKLRRVLIAYSWHNPAVGYCQGMNMLAATLLLTHSDEEQAYWTLLAIIERLLPTTFYSPTLLASRADQMVLADLVAQLVPKLHSHLEDLGVDLASITFGWFLSLFTDCLPVETLFRVWDVFFVEGRDTLFRVAVAILKLNEPDLVAIDSVSDLFAYISGMTSRLWAADKLLTLQHSYKPIIRHQDIVTRFDKHLKSLEAEMDPASMANHHTARDDANRMYEYTNM